jgi:hypothetical protein
MKNIVTILMLFLVLTFSACSPRFFGAMLMTAAIVGTVAVMAHHDAHFHDMNCGCNRRWHDGRWTYYYGDHWEYYDPTSGAWYYYEEYQSAS